MTRTALPVLDGVHNFGTATDPCPQDCQKYGGTMPLKVATGGGVFDRFRTALPFLLIAGVAGAVSLIALSHTPRATVSYYDEGVYYYQSVLLMDGRRPYTDFAVPQPPGILAIGSASIAAGTGVTGMRLVSWFCAMAVLYQTYWLGRCIAGRCEAESPNLVGITAAAFFIVSNRTVYLLTQGATEMPALALALAATQLLLVGGPKRAWVPGVVLGLATVFRLQPASYLPGYLLLIAATNGLRGSIRPVVLFLLGFGLTAALIHGALAALVPKYADCVFLFQFQRERMSVGEKALGLIRFLGEPHVGFAAVAVACLAAGCPPFGRGVGWYAAAVLLATSFSGNVLNLVYYVPVLPYMMTAAALVIDAACRALGGSRFVFVGAVTVAVAGSGLQNRFELMEQRRLDPIHRRFIDDVRSAPSETVWTLDGRIAALAGKRLVDDYYATDPNMLYARRRELFQTWIRNTLPKADLVAVTAGVVAFLRAPDARYIRASGKPMVFESDETEQAFQALAKSDVP